MKMGSLPVKSFAQERRKQFDRDLKKNSLKNQAASIFDGRNSAFSKILLSIHKEFNTFLTFEHYTWNLIASFPRQQTHSLVFRRKDLCEARVNSEVSSYFQTRCTLRQADPPSVLTSCGQEHN